MILPAATAWQAVAASSPSANDVTPGVLGFLVIAAMAGALYVLMRSMNKHLRKVREVRDAGLPPGSDLGAVMKRPVTGANDGGAARTTVRMDPAEGNGRSGGG